MVVIKEKYNIETIESNGLDKNILRKKGNAKTYSGWLIQRIKEARETNFETAIFLQELYNKYMEFEKTEKIKVKRWRGEKGEMKFWNKPDRIVIEFAQSRNKDQEPKRAKKEYLKQEINRMIWGLNKLKQEYDNKIPSRKLGELYFKGDWDSKVFTKRTKHQKFTHILNILDHYGMIHYSGGISIIKKEIREIQEILK